MSASSTSAENAAQPNHSGHNLLVQIADVQVKIEGVLKTAESKELIATAGKELLDWMTSIRTADLHEVLGDPIAIAISDDAAQRLSDFIKLLEGSVPNVKGAVSGFNITGRSASKKIRKCHKCLEDVWKLLKPHLITVNESPTLPTNPAEEGNLEPPENHSPKAPTWTKALEPSRTILKFVAAVTPLIPVVGQFVQCGVDVGNAIIDMLDGMSQNVQAIEDLCRRVTRLCSMIAIFQNEKGGFYSSGAAIQHLKAFKQLCHLVQEDVKKLKTQHPAGKVVFSSDNAASIGDLNGKIDQALKELDIYLALNANRLLEDLGQARLISLLGPDNWGNIGYTDEDGTCLPGTREKMLQQLDGWADDPASQPLRLVKGQAGRGKSTIAKTLAKRFRARHGNKTSCAVFHFRRTNEELNSRPIRSLALQLVRDGDSRLRNAILQAIHEREGVAGSHLEEQLRILLVKPLEKLKSDPPRVLLVIDGLDECGDHKFSASLLKLVLQYLPSLPSSVKLFITTRPEHHIVLVYQGLNENEELYDLDSVDVTDMALDLHMFFKQRLAEIRQYHKLRNAWPGDGAIDQLVDLSQGLFQWANTAIEFLDRAPEIRLRKLLHPKSNLVGLPALYRQIFEDAFPVESEVDEALIQYVLGSLVAAPNSISLASLAYLWDPPPDTEQYVSVDVGPEIQTEILDHLRSFLMVPAEPDEPIQILHTSVRDFLLNAKDCPDHRFFVQDARQCHERLAKSCLERMQRDLMDFDSGSICGPTQTSAEVQDAFRASVPSGLVFCARSWSTHLSQVEHDEGHIVCQGFHGLLDGFCRTILIYWIEILSLAGAVDEVDSITQQGKDWVGHDENYSQTYDLLGDVQRLCSKYLSPIATSAYHISRSVLLHFAEETSFRRTYSLGDHAPTIRRSLTRSNLQCRSMAISPDSKMFVFGSQDGAIWLWNSETGQSIGESLSGHSGRVLSVTFSPDGKMIASGCDDTTIRLWNPQTGTLIGEPLEGHTGTVWCVTFSPEGQMIASGSEDGTIRLWSPKTGTPVGGPIECHSRAVNSVAFSPDGKMIASGSDDHKIRLWNTETRTAIGEPLEGHTSRVWCVTFSPDGKMIASGSEDNSIRLWNHEIGTAIGEPLNGHSGLIRSVIFSPDGKLIVSGSADKTIQLWNPKTGIPIGEPMKGHTDWVRDITLSPDGKTIASSSDDNTIWFWDPETGRPIGESFAGCTTLINRVIFLPDGKVSASGFSDGTIRLWNLETGTPIGELLRGHSGWVNGVALSSDGKMFISGSSDGAIRVWNPESGNPLGEPLKGNHGAIDFVGFSSDDEIIASRSQDGTIQLWDVENWTQIGTVPSEQAKDHDRARIAPDSEALVALGNSGVRSQQKIVLHGENNGQDVKGWVFRDNRRWFWLPDTWYDSYEDQDLTASLFNNFFAIPHPDIPILGVSDVM